VAQVGQIVHAKSVQDPSRVFETILPVDGTAVPEALRPGMSVRVEIEIARLPQSLTIPLLAVRAGPEGTSVEVLDANGRAQTRAVKLGERNRDRVVVLEGLKDGERVRLGDAEAQT
jgi:multidrug efflux pump subunit AcrA (membrane-fusion protein)